MRASARRLLLLAIVATALAFPAAAVAAPPHDFWADALPVGLENNDVRTNAEATEALSSSGGEEPLTPAGVGFCNNGQFDDTSLTGIDMIHTVWYRVTGNGRPVTIDLRGSTIDTLVAVYRGSTTPSKATFEVCGDNISSTDADSEVLFNTDPGEAYLVQIGARRCTNPCGQGTIDFIAWTSEPGDFRDEAIALTTGVSRSANLTGASEEVDELVDCGPAPYSRTLWFRWTAPKAGTATFAAGGTLDTVIAVYRGNQLIGCDDDPSQVSKPVSAGVYHVQVGAYGIAPDAPYGPFSVKVDFVPTTDPPPPVRDGDGDGVPDGSDKCPTQNAAARDANRDGCLDPDPDPDGDGVPVGTDKCPSENARARDKDGDGCLDPLPRKRLAADARLRATPTSSGLRVVWLRVSAPKGSKVTVRCGAGCRYAKRATASGSDVLATVARTLTVKKLAGRTFRAGQKIRIYVTRKNRIGTYFQYTVQRGNFKRVKRCLNPGSLKPRKRCQ